ncbi:hypothetical protein BHM03_00028776 [Ensete ventricosum]|nr:hypothetical protein BHM03_00028776 [Ensete ventricosum]
MIDRSISLVVTIGSYQWKKNSRNPVWKRGRKGILKKEGSYPLVPKKENKAACRPAATLFWLLTHAKGRQAITYSASAVTRLARG